MIDLEENGVPQIVEEETPMSADDSIQSDNISETNENVSVDKIVTVNPVTESDIPSRYQDPTRPNRWNGPFSARMKVTNSYVLVTIKRADSEETQSFFIPVRW